VSDAVPVRGGICTYTGIRRSEFVVISVPTLNAAGTVIVVELADDAPTDARGLLAVQLTDADPLPGRWALAWRINYARADRFDVVGSHGILSENTLALIMRAVRAAIEP
jgi:hypothetical protein